jgi:ribosomal protein L16 Arg81 hydroxylase
MRLVVAGLPNALRHSELFLWRAIPAWIHRNGLDDLDALKHRIERGKSKLRVVGMRDERPWSVLLADKNSVPAWLESGFTIMVDDLPATIPALYELKQAAATDLGIPARSVDVKLSISPEGAGFPMHFDRHDSIQFQISGAKNWMLAPNRALRFPLHGCTLGMSVPKELRAYYPAGQPQPPSKRECIELSPGMILFVPRGYWHSTIAGEMSVSVVIRLAPPPWIQFLPTRYERRLSRDWRWREPSFWAWGSGTKTAAARRRMADLLRRENLPFSVADLLCDGVRSYHSYQASSVIKLALAKQTVL